MQYHGAFHAIQITAVCTKWKAASDFYKTLNTMQKSQKDLVLLRDAIVATIFLLGKMSPIGFSFHVL